MVQVRQAQPEGYFMLQYSAEKVTDQLQKSITVTHSAAEGA
ncbi:hypothetical protein [Klebsiella quasipneumoniae]|nr:hypothetical protein [Klebsiella quasipneumoniae]